MVWWISPSFIRFVDILLSEQRKQRVGLRGGSASFGVDPLSFDKYD